MIERPDDRTLHTKCPFACAHSRRNELTTMSLSIEEIMSWQVNDASVASASERIPAAVTDSQMVQFGRAFPFRGLLKDVRDAHNGELLAKADLAWKVHTMPVGAMGKTETRVAKGYQVLVRGDNADILSITSDQFKPHQNSEIIDDMQAMADAGNAQMLYAGPLDGGRKVVAIAKLAGEFSLPNKRNNTYRNDHAGSDFDDKTHLFAVISAGHEVGTPFKIRGMAFRQWCGNGAFFTTAAEATFSRSHRMKLDRARAEILACYDAIRREFGNYSVNAARLQEIAMERMQAGLYVAEILKPGIADQVAERAGMGNVTYSDIWGEVASSQRGRSAFVETLKASEKEAGFGRTAKNLLEAIATQDGANGPNLWSGYNGITWYVDHKRGRNDDSGMDAALFGAGATLKERALEVALEFVPAYAN